MGWGPLTLLTVRIGRPSEKILARFAPHGATVRLVEVMESDRQLDTYRFETDCGVTVYCAFCGQLMCPGCGSRPLLAITGLGASATCMTYECVAAFAKTNGLDLVFGKFGPGGVPSWGWRA